MWGRPEDESTRVKDPKSARHKVLRHSRANEAINAINMCWPLASSTAAADAKAFCSVAASASKRALAREEEKIGEG